MGALRFPNLSTSRQLAGERCRTASGVVRGRDDVDDAASGGVERVAGDGGRSGCELKRVRNAQGPGVIAERDAVRVLECERLEGAGGVRRERLIALGG